MIIEAHIPGPLTRDGIKVWVYALAAWDAQYLKKHPNTPQLYKSGVRYRADPIGSPEDFRPIPRVLQFGHGDCDDLAAWRVAELQVRHGIRARPEVIAIKPGLWHVFVRLPDGKAEDPSAHLGMKIPARFVAAGKRIAAKNHTPRSHRHVNVPAVAAAWPFWTK